jgi:hypothetical protein
MELSTTIGQLVAMDQALDRLIVEKWPIKAAYAISKLSRVVKKETAYAKTEQEKWIRELGAEKSPTPEQRAQGVSSTFEVTAEHMGTFLSRLSELYAVPVALQVTPLALASCDGVSVSAADVAVLADVITDD